ncbi:hypothetical protein Dda_6874 [Drechslerella dactyloides]|uniref:Uncharacterized protein n=1 Tax=Drechslerella dactyloides TaxID=74499 RepID=A0AAD6NHT6_DREDA|nr:hypothetical protein Dda_6874 [Drechslerella dactyloides]
MLQFDIAFSNIPVAVEKYTVRACPTPRSSSSLKISTSIATISPPKPGTLDEELDHPAFPPRAFIPRKNEQGSAALLDILGPHSPISRKQESPTRERVHSWEDIIDQGEDGQLQPTVSYHHH